MSEIETSSQQNSRVEEKIEKSTEEATSKVKTPTTPTSNNNWWGSWISQAKEKSASMLEAVKNDLNEITTAVTETLQLVPNEGELQQHRQMQSDSSNASDEQNTVNFANMKQSISSSISTFFGTVTDALIPQLDEEDTSEAVLITNDDTIVLTGFTKYLANLQSNDETYLEEPSKTEELSEKYRMWLEIVEQDQFTQQRVNKMLEQSTILNEKYNKFVPDTVSHMNFFKRYLFKKALLEDELANEERRQKEAQIIKKQPEAMIEEKLVTPISSSLSKSSSEVAPEPLAQKSPSRKNEMKDLDIANFEISEEEQARLLAEYEQEIKEREKTKTDDIIGSDDIDEVPVKSKEKISSKAVSNKKSMQSKSSAVANTTKGKNNDKDSKSQLPQQQQKSNQQKRGQIRSRGKKPDELPIDKDHFKKELESSTSDESWEKDFDI